LKDRNKWDDNVKMHRPVGWGWHGLELSGSGYGEVADSCDGSNEPSDSQKMQGIS